jgi:hypothetical protein
MAMYSPAIVFEALRLLRLRWKPQAIAETIHVPLGTVYRWESNLVRYGSGPMGRTPRLSPADRLEYEHGVQVSQSTISRLLKRQRWSKKEVRRISLTQSREARRRYREEISRFPADLNLSLTRKLAGGIWHMRLLGMRRDILRLFGVERPGVSLQQ